MKLGKITYIAVALILTTLFTIGAFAQPIQDRLQDGTCDYFDGLGDNDRLQDGTRNNCITDCEGDQLRDRSCDKISTDCTGIQKHDRDRTCRNT